MDKQDRQRDQITEGDAQFIVQVTREILEDLAQDRPDAAPEASSGAPERPASAPVPLLMCPARDEIDRVALAMLGQLFDPARSQLDTIGAPMLTSEVAERVQDERPAIVVIGAVAPGGMTHTRHLCKRLRARYPELKLVVGRWGLHEEQEDERGALLGAGADRVATSVLDAQHQLAELSPLLPRVGRGDEQQALAHVSPARARAPD